MTMLPVPRYRTRRRASTASPTLTSRAPRPQYRSDGRRAAGAPLETLRIISDGYSYFYSLCLDGLNATVQPVVGYFESGSWHGYPEVTIAGHTYPVPQPFLARQTAEAHTSLYLSILGAAG